MEVTIITALLIVVLGIMDLKPKTTVTLLDSGKKSSIEVTTNKGSVVLDKVGAQTKLASKDEEPTKATIIDVQELEKDYENTMKSLPLHPANILLYFKKNSTQLTDESKDKIALIKEAVRKRVPCDVTVIGHTDTQGSAKYNQQLSLKRASEIKIWLEGLGFEIARLSVDGYGESDLLVPTKDGVAEPKNRRVELLIR